MSNVSLGSIKNNIVSAAHHAKAKAKGALNSVKKKLPARTSAPRSYNKVAKGQELVGNTRVDKGAERANVKREPMLPPIVAEKSCELSTADNRCSFPSERSSVRASTWEPKVPRRWWFLPWTSLAMAPPRVTNWVPGTTAGK